MHLPKLLREGAAHSWLGQWLCKRELFRALLKSVVRSHLIRRDQKVQRFALAPPVGSYYPFSCFSIPKLLTAPLRTLQRCNMTIYPFVRMDSRVAFRFRRPECSHSSRAHSAGLLLTR